MDVVVELVDDLSRRVVLAGDGGETAGSLGGHAEHLPLIYGSRQQQGVATRAWFRGHFDVLSPWPKKLVNRSAEHRLKYAASRGSSAQWRAVLVAFAAAQ